MEEFAAWLIRTFGRAVLDWTVRQLLQRMQSEDSAPEFPHGASCRCHECGTVFDDDELGIDPEAEGWDENA